MRKTVITGFALCLSVICHAALPTVQSVEKVNVAGNTAVSMATLSPDGTYAVVSPLSGVGLNCLNLGSGQMFEISKIGSPMSVGFTTDGNDVVYRESTYDSNHRRFVSLKSYNINTGKETTLVSNSRKLQGFAVDGNEVVAVENGMKRASKLSAESNAVGRPTLSINLGKLCITTPDGKTSELSPLGDRCNSYIWESISPDGTKILAFGVGTGAFVCDLAGNNVQLLGMYRAPVWYDNQTVMAMDDYDDGVKTVKSTIMALSIDGKEKAALTGDDVVAVFPTAARNKVAFTTPEGELYIINLK